MITGMGDRQETFRRIADVWQLEADLGTLDELVTGATSVTSVRVTVTSHSSSTTLPRTARPRRMCAFASSTSSARANMSPPG
jgi:hypothetical protein